MCVRAEGLEGVQALRKHLGRVDVAINHLWAPRCLILSAKPRAKPRLSEAPAALVFVHFPLFGAFRGAERGLQVQQVRNEPRRAGRDGQGHPRVFTEET